MILIDHHEFNLEQLRQVACLGEDVGLSDQAQWRERMERSRALLDAALEAGRPVYGVSSGVGNSSSVVLGRHEQHDFARRLIRHHGCGLGERFPDPETRAIIFCRVVGLAKGCSAVRVELLQAMCDLLNLGVIPVIPRLGSVGASGDLTPLSYLAAVLMGEREAIFRGELMTAAQALGHADLKPFSVAPKETLAIMNCTAAMTAVAGLTALRLRRVLGLAERSTALLAEVMRARTQPFHPVAHKVKPHPGQVHSAEAIYLALQGSQMVDPERDVGALQDPYSIRCAPQVLGAARDALTWVEQVIQRELNSVDDNPIVDPESELILFAGNFYGGHLGLTMDMVKIAASTVADLLDRQLALMLDSRYNHGLPDTLVKYPGQGIKGMQITASALTALTVQRSASDSVLSRPTEVGNQDKVSMGLNAALNAAESVRLLQHVLATLLVALSNAASLRGDERFSPAARVLLARVRECSKVLTADRRLDHDLERLADELMELGPVKEGAAK